MEMEGTPTLQETWRTSRPAPQSDLKVGIPADHGKGDLVVPNEFRLSLKRCETWVPLFLFGAPFWLVFPLGKAKGAVACNTSRQTIPHVDWKI